MSTGVQYIIAPPTLCPEAAEGQLPDAPDFPIAAFDLVAALPSYGEVRRHHTALISTRVGQPSCPLIFVQEALLFA
jgi:hypothetical protein